MPKKRVPDSKMEVDSHGEDVEMDSDLALYLDTPNRLTRWRSYFDELIQVGRETALGSFKPEKSETSISLERIYTGLLATETEGRIIRAIEQRKLARQYSIYELPFNIFYDFLDTTFGFNGPDTASSNPSILQRDVHLLHELEKGSPAAKEYIGRWVACSYVKDSFDAYTRSFPGYEEAATEYAAIQTLYASSLDHSDLDGQLGVERGLPRGGTTLAYSCAANCVDCLDFLIRHELILAEGYDGNGFNWLDAVIRGKNQAAFIYLIEKLPASQFYNYTYVHHVRNKTITYNEKKAVLRLITRENWTWAAEYIVYRFIKAKKVRLLHEYVDFPTKARLNRFLDPKAAEALRKAKFNIADIPYEIPGEEQSAWHIAALHNPHGEAYMDWLFISAPGDVTTDNFKGKDTLQIAAAGNNPTCIQWLCKHLDSFKIWERPSEGRSLMNEYTGCALEIAARNMTNLSVFETMMDCVGDEAFEDFDLAVSLFKAVCSGLDEFTTHGPAARTTVARATEIAKLKFEVIMERLPEKEWLESAELADAMGAVWRYGFSNLAGSLTSFSNAIRDRKAARAAV